MLITASDATFGQALKLHLIALCVGYLKEVSNR